MNRQGNFTRAPDISTYFQQVARFFPNCETGNDAGLTANYNAITGRTANWLMPNYADTTGMRAAMATGTQASVFDTVARPHELCFSVARLWLILKTVASMVTPVLPVLFVLLWSSAFICAKFGLPYAGPFSFMLTRFVIVFLLFAAIALVLRRPWPRGAIVADLLFVGVLMHGFYLGGVFFAIAQGMPAGLSALIVSTQPALSAVLGIWLLNEWPKPVQWLGIVLGTVGVVLVLWPRLGGDVPLIGLVACIISLIAITLGTIWQKRHGGGMDLLSGNAIQAMAAVLFYGLIVLVFEPYRVEWTIEFSLALGWLVVALSLGAVSILMVLIKRGSAAATTSLFFLVPPASAIMAWLAFGEALGPTGLAGLGITTVGVWLLNRRANVAMQLR